MTGSPLIGLWRSAPARYGGGGEKHIAGPKLAPAHIFPSGRAALVEALRRLGLARHHTVAVPPYSSTCVNGAVGKVAAPVLFSAAGPRPDAILVYEQWGWPTPALALARLRDALDGAPIILDSVDVPFPGPAAEDPMPLAAPAVPAFRVWSFGKVLGTLGGGLLTAADGLVPHCVPPGARVDFAAFRAAAEGLGLPSVTDLFRSQSPVPPDDLMNILDAGGLEAALADEAAARRANVRALSKSDGAGLWRPWMFDAIRGGAAPGLAPICIGESPETLQEIGDLWRTRWNIETTTYHFNLSGDLLKPEYVPCLAVPIHSGVTPELLAEAATRRKSRGRARKGHALVVGGGIAGIFAARMLADRYGEVAVLETGPKIGGMMRSVEVEGTHFDYGTHVPMAIGHADIDRMMFEGAAPKDWNRIPRSLREGVFHNGRLDTASGCLDADILPPELRDRALRELAEAAAKTPARAANLEERLLQDYGETLARQVLSPVVKRLIGCEPSEVVPEVLDTFSLRRVRMFDGATAATLKASPALDARIAFRATGDGLSNILKLYPKRGGAQLWLDGLLEAARERGVSVRTRAAISGIRISDGAVSSVALADGTVMDCDLLVWTPPPITYLKTVGIAAPSAPPRFLDMAFVHLAFDAPFPHDLEYMCCYDDGFLTYRVTFYPALKGNGTIPPYTATAEILLPSGMRESLPGDAALVSRIADELREMELISGTAKVAGGHVVHQRNALPLATPDSAAAFAEQVAISRRTARNLLLIGRNNFKHFLNDVLRDTYAQAMNFTPSGL